MESIKNLAVVSSQLTSGDTYMLFHFEDTQTSSRLYVKDSYNSLKEFVNDDVHTIRLSKDLIWHTDETPHLSIIARTRSGKSVLAGRYMARLMQLQGWTVEYNSAKYDRYVKEFSGKSSVVEIVERTEHWVQIMLDRLEEINKADKEKYLEMPDMSDIAIFIDELGNLNAELESDKPLKNAGKALLINFLQPEPALVFILLLSVSLLLKRDFYLQ